jgi:hypothetical protein
MDFPDTFAAYCGQTDQERADNAPLVIGGRFFVYDEEGHKMVETDSEGVPLCPPTQRSGQ